MKEVKLTLYKFEELPREIIDKIVDEKRWDVMGRMMELYGCDYRNSLDAFEKLTDSQIVTFHVDYCNYRFKFELTYDVDGPYRFLEYVSGKELYNYVMENIYPYLLDKDKNLKECPLTGMCYDNYFLDPLLKYINEWETYKDDFTYEDLLDQCYDSFFSEWHKEYEYWADTDSAIEEELEYWYENDWFDEDGTMCNIKLEIA